MHRFQRFGLSFYESKALDILIVQRVTPKELSKRSGIPPGKIYSVIKSLKSRGIIQETDERPKYVFVSNPSKVVAALIATQQAEQEKVYDELRRVTATAIREQTKQNSFFDIGTSIEENHRIQLRSFTEAEYEVCQIINIHHKPQSNRQSKSLWEKEIGNAVSRGVKFRCIYPESAKIPTMFNLLPKKNFQIRRLDTDFTRIDVIDKKKVLIKLMHDDPLTFGGVLFIESERLAKNLQKVFDQFWEEAGLKE